MVGFTYFFSRIKVRAANGARAAYDYPRICKVIIARRRRWRRRGNAANKVPAESFKGREVVFRDLLMHTAGDCRIHDPDVIPGNRGSFPMARLIPIAAASRRTSGRQPQLFSIRTLYNKSLAGKINLTAPADRHDALSCGEGAWRCAGTKAKDVPNGYWDRAAPA